jgi:hypothetical protein
MLCDQAQNYKPKHSKLHSAALPFLLVKGAGALGVVGKTT